MKPTVLQRLLTEDHMRRRLQALGKWLIYRDLREDPPREAAVTADQRSRLEAFVSTLSAASGISRLARIAVVTLPPAATTLYALMGKQPGPEGALIGFLPQLSKLQLAIFLIPLATVLGLASASFTSKRASFLRNEVDGRNIYRLEDEAFALLDIPKKREFPLDLFAAIVIAVLCITNAALFNLQYWPDVPTLLLGVVSVGAIPFLVRKWRRREPR